MKMISIDQAASQTTPNTLRATTTVEHAWPKPAKRFSSTFFKLLYRWTHGDEYRHNERLWRDVKITRDADGFLAGMSIRGREIRVENSRNLAVTRPAACHLIATGPSVNEIDYGALRLHHAMGVNGAISLQQRHDLSFESYCIIDAGFVRNRPDLVAQVVQQDLTFFTTPLVLWYIAQCLPLEQIRCRIFLIEDMQQPALKRSLRACDLLRIQANGDAVLFDEAAPLGFSMNVRRGVIDGRTVAYAALQILVSLGFDKVFLHGLDLRNATHTPRFYETANAMQPSSLDQQFSDFIEPSFRGASTLLESLGIDVRNLSRDSALDCAIFEKIDWRSLAPAQSATANTESAIYA